MAYSFAKKVNSYFHKSLDALLDSGAGIEPASLSAQAYEACYLPLVIPRNDKYPYSLVHCYL